MGFQIFNSSPIQDLVQTGDIMESFKTAKSVMNVTSLVDTSISVRLLTAVKVSIRK